MGRIAQSGEIEDPQRHTGLIDAKLTFLMTMTLPSWWIKPLAHDMIEGEKPK